MFRSRAFFFVFSLLLALAPASLLAADPAALTRQPWLLDGIRVEPSEDPLAAGLKRQIGRTHPIGRTFIELRADGSFTLIRGDEGSWIGAWTLVEKTLTLQRHDAAGAPLGQPRTFLVAEAAAERLQLSTSPTPDLPTAFLEFSPSRLPR